MAADGQLAFATSKPRNVRTVASETGRAGKVVKEEPAKSKQYIQRLYWHLARVDSWISNADTKAMIMLGIDGFGASMGVFLSYNLRVYKGGGWYLVTLFYVFWGALLVSMLSVICAIMPNIKRLKGTSLLHFVPVESLQFPEFQSQYRGITEETYKGFLEEQIYINSKIAASKFRRLRFAIYCFLLVLLSGVIAFVFGVFLIK